jgi:uncharacterized protein (TIGR02265 family)
VHAGRVLDSRAVTRIETSAGVALTDDFDPEAVIRSIPDDYTRKGLVFAQHVSALGEDLAALPLETPGRYSPLESYPARDYFRIFNAVAERAFPSLPRSQQWRLLGRREIGAVTNTNLGRIEWSALNGPGEALLRYQQFSPFVVNKPRGTASPLPNLGVRIEYIDRVVSIPYGVGVFEGVVLSFGMHPRIAIETAGDITTFDVRWGL